jgi:acetyl-CoA carboxylase carboxyl transferase subunit alpha
MEIIDGIIPEISGGAHRDVTAQALAIKECLLEELTKLQLLSPEELIEDRYKKFRVIGEFIEQ